MATTNLIEGEYIDDLDTYFGVLEIRSVEPFVYMRGNESITAFQLRVKTVNCKYLDAIYKLRTFLSDFLNCEAQTYANRNSAVYSAVHRIREELKYDKKSASVTNVGARVKYDIWVGSQPIFDFILE